MDKRGIGVLTIILIVAAVAVIGGVVLYSLLGNSDDNVINGTNGGSGDSSGRGFSSSWCSGQGGTIETFKGREACHTSTLSGEVYTYIIDKDYWVIQSQAYNYESHFVNGKVTELNCLSENPQLLANCEQFKTMYCPTCP